MGHIQKRGDRKYRARYLDPDGRERSRTFTRKIDAEKFLATVEADKLRGTYVDTSHATTVARLRPAVGGGAAAEAGDSETGFLTDRQAHRGDQHRKPTIARRTAQ